MATNPNIGTIPLKIEYNLATEDVDNNNSPVDESKYKVDLVSSGLKENKNDIRYIHFPIEETYGEGSYWLTAILPTPARDSLVIVYSVKDQTYTDGGYKWFIDKVPGGYITKMTGWLNNFQPYPKYQLTFPDRAIKFNFFGLTTNKPNKAQPFEIKFISRQKKKDIGDFEAILANQDLLAGAPIDATVTESIDPNLLIRR